MRAVLIRVMCLCVALSAANLSSAEARRYFVEEERRHDRKMFAVIPDGDGRPHLVNLRRQPKVDVRVQPEDVHIHFHTKHAPNVNLEIDVANFDGRINSEYFDPRKDLVLITHGWTSSNLSFSCVTTREQFVLEDKRNVFVLDWSRHSHEFYTAAKEAVPQIGQIVARFIEKIVNTYNMTAGDVMLVGNSLGAHVVGAIGAAMSPRPGFIVGLDPALPLFYVDEPQHRLDVEDAEVVHVMHTNGGFLGFRSSIGHADYFANGGGMDQPGCGPDLFGTCAHGRSVYIFAESIITSDFKALKCNSYEDFQEGLCDNNEHSFFGTSHLNSNAHGDYHLNTNSKAPYALN